MKKIVQWIPLFVMLVISLVVFIIYPYTTSEPRTLVKFQIIICAFIPALLPILGKILKREFPVVLNILITSHVFFAIYLGTALGFYYYFPWWDVFLHGYFGFVCCPIIFCLLIMWNGRSLNSVGFFIIIFAFVMALAGLWEVFEYITDNLFGNDAQGVQSYVPGEGAPSPLADTMEDIMISAAGVALFYLCVFIDKLNGYLLSKSLYESFKPKEEKNAALTQSENTN